MLDEKWVRRLKSNGGDDIKIDYIEVGYEGATSVYVLQNKDQWRAFVNTVMNLQVQQREEKSLDT